MKKLVEESSIVKSSKIVRVKIMIREVQRGNSYFIQFLPGKIYHLGRFFILGLFYNFFYELFTIGS